MVLKRLMNSNFLAGLPMTLFLVVAVVVVVVLAAASKSLGSLWIH
ncbi:hypothetical protein E2C01_047132 [Portunus trituberculatus]|uniref:Uncharacterized protein n=1 Tax=Portunus trituberculatus TaxID=210409 RepID=A0A5B7G7Q1_PORTR|nr:hypothetical protein [Portunus trituberculatus]